MDLPYVSALSALAGSVIGGVTSTSVTWLTQRAQARSGQLAHEFTRREELYRDFIVAASKTYGDALAVLLHALARVHRRQWRGDPARLDRCEQRSEHLEQVLGVPGEGHLLAVRSRGFPLERLASDEVVIEPDVS
jgi:hypothetical protein